MRLSKNLAIVRRYVVLPFPPITRFPIAMAKKKQSDKAPSQSSQSEVDGFESALSAVEDVVRRLESGELGLSESLTQYERGIEKIKVCHRALEQAEQRIAVLTAVDEDGTATVEPVETASGGTQSKKSSTAKNPPKRTAPKRPAPADDMDDSGGLF